MKTGLVNKKRNEKEIMLCAILVFNVLFLKNCNTGIPTNKNKPG